MFSLCLGTAYSSLIAEYDKHANRCLKHLTGTAYVGISLTH